MCGGREPHISDNDQCYRYDALLDSWTASASAGGTLSVPRHEAGCAFSDYYGGMVISGGYDDVDSIEFTEDGVTFSREQTTVKYLA